MQLEGLVPPMVTPTADRRGTVDTDALGSLVTHLREGGVDGLFPLGSTGEFTSLPRDQRRVAVETVVDASGNLPVVVGCGGTSVAAVRGHVETATEAGADAAVVVTPYYLPTTDEGLGAFYETVADEASIPILLYAIPSLAGQHLPVDLVADLVDHPDILGIKDSTGDLSYHARLLDRVGDDCVVFQGASHLLAPALDLGADGGTPSIANVLPERVSRIFASHREGDHAATYDLMREVIYPYSTATESVAAHPMALKHLLERAGVPAGPPVLPLPELTGRQRETLDAYYEHVAAGQ